MRAVSTIVLVTSCNVEGKMDSHDRETCTLCLEDFTEPKVFPCGHKFCKKCLEELLTQVEDGDPLSCPNCRKEFPVPDCGADAFLTDVDFDAQRSAEHILPSLEKEEDCKSCENRCTPSAYCAECEGGICEECVETHRKIKKLKSHYVVASKDFSLDSFKPQPKPQQCSKHEKALELFCEECGWPLCSECLVSAPRSHDTHIDEVKAIEKVREEREREVRELRECAERMLLSNKECVQYLTEVGKKMATYPEELAKIINDTFDEYVEILETWRGQQLQEASEKSAEMIKRVSSQTIDKGNRIDKLQSGIELADKALRCTSNAAAVAMSGLAIKELDVEPLESDQALSKPLVFSKGLRLGGLTEIAAGNIKVTIPEVCIMGEPIAINVSFDVTFHTKPLIKVLYGSRKQRSITLQPESIVDSACTVSYQPRCAGKHSIEVHINGVLCAKYDIMDVGGAPEVGVKVKPGPDWQGEEEEVGESGIILDVGRKEGWKFAAVCYYVLTVRWENEQVKKYEWGNNNKYKLELDI